MRTIIAGSRGITDQAQVEKAVEVAGWLITCVLSSAARGVDRLGEQWALDNGVQIEQFKPDWKTFGKGAGIKRNAEMAAKAEALIALWDGESTGTKDMIERAQKAGLRVHVHLVYPSQPFC